MAPHMEQCRCSRCSWAAAAQARSRNTFGPLGNEFFGSIVQDGDALKIKLAASNKGIAISSKKLLVAPGITTRNKKLLVTRQL